MILDKFRKKSCQPLPKVGICWKSSETGMDLPLWVDVDEGVRHGDIITGPKTHAEHWEECRLDGTLDGFTDPFRKTYFTMPRVRVVYNTVKDKFFVYHADNLKGDGFVDILRTFALPIDKTVFEIDLDYCNYDKELLSESWHRSDLAAFTKIVERLRGEKSDQGYSHGWVRKNITMLDSLKALKIFLDNKVEFINLIFESKNNEDCKKKLETKYSLTDIQAEVILDCKIKWLCEFDRNKLDKEIEDWSNILI